MMQSQEKGSLPGELDQVESKPVLLANIQGLLSELSGYVGNTEYRKGYVFKFAAETACFDEVDITSSYNNEDRTCAVELALSYLDTQGGRRWAVARLEQSDDRGWLPNFQGPNGLTSEELSQRIPKGLPPPVADMVGLIYAASSKTGGSADPVPADRALALWQAVDAALDEVEATASYNCYYDTVINGRAVSVDALGLLPKSDDIYTSPKEWIDHSHIRIRVSDAFEFTHSTNRGFIKEGFNYISDMISDDELPPLTDEELGRRSYTVVLSSIPGLEKEFAMRPFKVVPLLMDGRLVGRIVGRAATEEEAWEIADLMDMRKLARAKVSNKVTPERLKLVRDTLGIVLVDAQTRWLCLHNELARLS